MPFVTLTVELPSQVIASLRTRLNQPNGGLALREHENVLRGMLGGVDGYKGYFRSQIASACAVGTYTCVYGDAVFDTDIATIGGTALAYVETPASTAQFTHTAATDAGLAAGLAAAINANATLAKIVRATVADAVVTVTALLPGPVGNLITLAETGNGLTKSSTVLADGVSDAPYGYEFGYTPAV